MASSSKGQRREGWQTFGSYARLMRPSFPNLLPLFGEISSNHSYLGWITDLQVNAFALSMTTGRNSAYEAKYMPNVVWLSVFLFARITGRPLNRF